MWTTAKACAVSVLFGMARSFEDSSNIEEALLEDADDTTCADGEGCALSLRQLRGKSGHNYTGIDSGDDMYGPYGKEPFMIYSGKWGEWKDWVETNRGGLYACGAELRFEKWQQQGDDTGANGLKLRYCGLKDWRNQQSQTIWSGHWGDWKGWVMCPYGKYIGGANVRFQDYQGIGLDHDWKPADDTALNGLRIWCVHQDWTGGEEKSVFEGFWGGWKGMKKSTGKLVKGARVRNEGYQGTGNDHDDTALNGIEFKVEKPNFGVSNAKVQGEWVSVASGPQGYVKQTVTESTTTTDTKEMTKEQSYGFQQSISLGFKIRKVVDMSVSVSASQSSRTARMMSHSLAVGRSVQRTLSCPDKGSPTGIYFMWQWKMSQGGDSSGPGFNSLSQNIRCTASFDQPPQCALGSCEDHLCQKCKS